MRVKQMALKSSPSHNPFLQHPAMADPHSSKHTKEAWDLEGESMHLDMHPHGNIGKQLLDFIIIRLC